MSPVVPFVVPATAIVVGTSASYIAKVGLAAGDVTADEVTVALAGAAAKSRQDMASVNAIGMIAAGCLMIPARVDMLVPPGARVKGVEPDCPRARDG